MALAIVGHSELTAAEPADFSVNRPSFYADPAAWMVAAAVERALAGPDGTSGIAPAELDETGIIVAAESLALQTFGVIAAGASRGRVSPLRFAGCNPGILAGLSCIRHGFRGPSLVLNGIFMKAVQAALAVASDWLEHDQAQQVICATYQGDAGRHAVKWVVLRAAPTHTAQRGQRADDVYQLLIGAQKARRN
jgi:hypothetical protein